MPIRRTGVRVLECGNIDPKLTNHVGMVGTRVGLNHNGQHWRDGKVTYSIVMLSDDPTDVCWALGVESA